MCGWVFVFNGQYCNTLILFHDAFQGGKEYRQALNRTVQDMSSCVLLCMANESYKFSSQINEKSASHLLKMENSVTQSCSFHCTIVITHQQYIKTGLFALNDSNGFNPQVFTPCGLINYPQWFIYPHPMWFVINPTWLHGLSCQKEVCVYIICTTSQLADSLWLKEMRPNDHDVLKRLES